MRKFVIVLSLVMTFSHLLCSQELTVEYNIGYGKFCMRDLRHYIEDAAPEFSSRLYNSNVLKNFPGNLTHQAKIGVELNLIHQLGFSLDFMSTEGSKTMIDASYDINYCTKGTRVGLFYRITPSIWSEGIVRPYFMLTAGTVINNDRVKISGEMQNDTDLKLNGAIAFAEPALGCKIRLHDMFALNINAGYHLDLDKIYQKSNSDNFASPTWGGVRFQGGLIFYIPLAKK